MLEALHTRQAADLQVAIWIDPDQRLSVCVSDASGDFLIPARNGHDALEKFWHPYLYQPRKEA
ncbi:MAG TPA: hypothetical protein VNH40_01950 [Gaiellaceae bacterium]|nr:hypothetical protein [Gaiellaceae bacterium]